MSLTFKKSLMQLIGFERNLEKLLFREKKVKGLYHRTEQTVLIVTVAKQKRCQKQQSG